MINDKFLFACRLPVELGGMLTVMPLHSITASALFTSLLSLSSHSWGCLSEGRSVISDDHDHLVEKLCGEISVA